MSRQSHSRPGWRDRLRIGAVALSLSIGGSLPALSSLIAQEKPPDAAAPLLPAPVPTPAPAAAVPSAPTAVCPEDEGPVYPIDLPAALKLVNENNPTIAIARERIEQAYYLAREARFFWLPNLQIVPGVYTRHDGQIQDVIFGLVRTSSWGDHYTYGGAVMNYATSDAYFFPLIRRQLLNAERDAARATTNDVQLQVALAYLDLWSVYGQMAIKNDTLARAREMLHNAETAAEAGKSSTSSDVQRARTEVETRLQERINLEAQAAQFSALLAQLLLLQPTIDLRPAEPAIVPIVLVPDHVSLDELVRVGLMNRPELAQNRALVEAALIGWRQARARPLLPIIQVQYTGGVFGGGPGGTLDNFSGRSDGTAMAMWQLTNLGAGDIARARAQKSVYAQANLRVVEVQAQIAAEVTSAAKTARVRLKTLGAAQEGVRQALEMWRRLQESTFGLAIPTGKYDPLGPLLAEQALDQARGLYLSEVIEYNKAQFRLFTALGQPSMEALCQATPISVTVPVVPETAPAAAQPLPPPRPVEKKE